MVFIASSDRLRLEKVGCILLYLRTREHKGDCDLRKTHTRCTRIPSNTMRNALTHTHKQVGPTLCPADQGQWSEVVLADSIQHYLIHGWHFFKSALTWEDTMETVQHSIPLCVRVCVCVWISTVMHVHLMCGIPEAQTLVLTRIHSAEVSLSVLAELKGGSACSTTNTQLDTYICENDFDNLSYALHMLYTYWSPSLCLSSHPLSR